MTCKNCQEQWDVEEVIEFFDGDDDMVVTCETMQICPACVSDTELYPE